MNLNFLYQGAGPLKHVALDPAPWCTYRQFVKGKKAKIFLLVIELAFWRKGIILIDRLTDTSSLEFIQSFWRKSSYYLRQKKRSSYRNSINFGRVLLLNE